MFNGQSYADTKKIQEVLKKILAQSQHGQDRIHFNINELRRMEGNEKVGSLIDDVKDIERGTQPTTVAFYKLSNSWIKGIKLKTSTKIKLYKSLVKSILLYECRTWALTLTEEEGLNAYRIT